MPQAEQSFASAYSTMLVFDYLIGNPDRFSGSNLKTDAQGRRIYVRDHDMAFPVRLSEDRHRRLIERVLALRHFSRSFYQRVRALTRERFENELARDPMGAPGELLSEAQIAGVLDRREAFISHVESLGRLGHPDQVLDLP